MFVQLCIESAVPASSSSTCCKASYCVFPPYLPVRMYRKPRLFCDQWKPGSRGLSPESCQNCSYSLPSSFIWRANTTKPSADHELNAPSWHAFAVTNATFSFSTGLALCVSPHCDALLHLCHYWHAGKILALILTISHLAFSRWFRVQMGSCLRSRINTWLRTRRKSRVR